MKPRKLRRRFPLSAAKGSATVGGLVSTNAGGTQVLRFDPMRSLILKYRKPCKTETRVGKSRRRQAGQWIRGPAGPLSR